jgi:hypothetical protein
MAKAGVTEVVTLNVYVNVLNISGSGGVATLNHLRTETDPAQSPPSSSPPRQQS